MHENKLRFQILIIVARLLLVFVLGFMVVPCSAHDPGLPDTVYFSDWQIYVVGPPYRGNAVVSVMLFDDSLGLEPGLHKGITQIACCLGWDAPISLDSVSFRNTRAEPYLRFPFAAYIEDSLNRRLCFGMFTDAMPPSRGPIAHLFFAVQDTGQGLLDTVLFYRPTLSLANAWDYWVPQFVSTRFEVHGAVVPDGDVNGDSIASDMIDIVYLINYVFWSGIPPMVLNSADVDQSCVIDILDIVYLINYVYWGDPPPLRGCVP